jgi:hypothetical protein
MAKEVFKNAKLYIPPNATATMFVAADNTARDLLSPASGDFCLVLDRTSGRVDKYNGSWAASTEADYCFTDVTYSDAFDNVDQTDSCTTGDTTESQTTRDEITMSLTRILRDSAGAKLTGKDLEVTYDSSPLSASEVTLNESYTEIDTTDSETSGVLKEFTLDRVVNDIEVSRIQQNTEDDLVLATDKSFEVSLVSSPTTTYGGTVELNNKEITTSLGSATEIKYAGQVQGAVAFTGIDDMITSRRGWALLTGDGKSYSSESASINHVTRSITAPIDNNITIAETFRINTTVSETKGS